jgi:outer membrane protein TolC
MNRFLILITPIVCSLPIQAMAQEANSLLTWEQAVDLTLSNNKTLKIEQKSVEVAENNRFRGNAGQLPTVSLGASGLYSQSLAQLAIRTFQENPPLVEIDEEGVASTTWTTAIRADYVVFGGGRSRYTYRLLGDQSALARYQQEVVLNELVLTVTSLYLGIAKLQAREALLEENVEISKSQLRRIEDQQAFGQVTGSLVLAAQTDINQELNFLEDLRLQKNNLLKELNLLMGVPPEMDYQVEVRFENPEQLELEELKSLILAQNPTLKLSKSQSSLSGNQLKVAQSARYPQLNAFADYGFLRQDNDAQQLAKLQTLGYSAGLSLSLVLFDGERVSRTIRSAQLGVETAAIQQSLVEDQLIKDAVKEQSQMTLLFQKLKRQENDLGTFEDFFARTQERFERGLATSLELREAQRALLDARIRLVDSRLNLLESKARIASLTGETLDALTN